MAFLIQFSCLGKQSRRSRVLTFLQFKSYLIKSLRNEDGSTAFLDRLQVKPADLRGLFDFKNMTFFRFFRIFRAKAQ